MQDAAAVPAASRPSRRTRRDLRAIAGDGVAFSLMVGAGETYVPAFVLALGFSDVAAGWIASLPLLAGAILQLVSPGAIRRLGSHRRWVVICAIVQALSFGAYIAAALLGWVPAWALFIAAAIYWGAGLGTGPAWNTWVSTLVPKSMRARFFAHRSRLAQGAVLAGLVGGGWALQLGERHDRLMTVFAALFAVAALARMISVGLLWSQSEPRPMNRAHRNVPVREWIRRARHSDEGRLLIYLLAVQLAVQISAPFFTPFMLSQLDFSYGVYLALMTTTFASKMITLPLLGRLAHRRGSQWLLYGAGVGIVPLAGLWAISDSFGFLLVVQLFSGAIWAAFELSTFLLLFERIPEHERTSVLTTYNLAHASATVGGAVAGGTVLHLLGAEKSTYLLLFALSTVARALTVLLLARLRRVQFEPRAVNIRPLGVRPNTGSVDAPIVAK